MGRERILTDELEQTALIVEAVECMTQSVVIYDENDRVLYANPAAQEELKEFLQLLTDKGSFYEALLDLICTRMPTADDATRVIFTDETYRRLMAGLPVHLLTSKGRVCLGVHHTMSNGRYVSFTMDVHELQERKKELKKAWQKAESSNQAKSTFLANISHEIRTPLNGILGMAHALSTSELNIEQQEQISALIDSGRVLLNLLNDVLDFSKIEAGRLDLSPTETDLPLLISHCQKLWQPRANEKGIALTVTRDEGVDKYYLVDGMRVTQCISNLISNAIKFTNQGSVDVHVSVRKGEDDVRWITIDVKDTGIGISPKVVDRVFEPFHQADASTSRSFGGTGLGLSIVRKFAQMMDGDVSAMSTPGAGSLFSFKFKASSIDCKTHTAGLIDDAGADYNYFSGLRVLLVDDSVLNRQIVQLFLKPYGPIIRDAENGKVALDALQEDTFDLVLLDMHMPVMDGLEVIRRIREADQPWRTIPTIALTADALRGDRERYLASGMSGYVAKPIDLNDLLNEMRRVLNGPKSQTQIRESLQAKV